MEATIPGKSLLVFGKMLQSLAKIGDDLFFDAVDDQVRYYHAHFRAVKASWHTKQLLVLRALNQTRSAYFCYNLHASFFEHYNVAANVRFKVVLKSCVAVFRALEKVQRCDVQVDDQAERVTFVLHCALGVRKTYSLDVEECDPLQAVYAKDQCPFSLALLPHVLGAALGNFPIALDEITLVLSPAQVILRSHVEQNPSEPLTKKHLSTEMALSVADFDSYVFEHSRTVELTFSLRDLRALLTFAEKQPQPLTMYMDTEGRPVLLSLSLRGFYEAEFVLATLSRADEPTQPTYDSSSANASRSNARSDAVSPGGSYASNRRRREGNAGEPAAKKARVDDNQGERVVSDKVSEEMMFDEAEDADESGLGLWTRPALVQDAEMADQQ